MFSNRSNPATRFLASGLPVLALLAVATLSIHCGKKGPPRPPPSKIPSSISDLTVQQRGMELLLRMTYPTTTIGGHPLEAVDAIEVSELIRIIPVFMDLPGTTPEEATVGAEDLDATTEEVVTEPEVQEETDDPDEGLLFQVPSGDEATSTIEDQIQVDPREFDQAGTLAWSIREPELQSAVIGDSLVARVHLDEIPEVDEIYVYGARVYASERLVSAVSNLVKLRPRNPPPPPLNVTVEGSQTAIQINWEAPTVAKTESNDDLSVQGFNVYRRNANVREYGLPLFTAPKTFESYMDTSAAFDTRYIYAVTTIGSRTPLIESAVGAEHEVNYKDRFEPRPPREVTALPETDQVRLLWEVSTSEDVVGYHVYRQDPGGEFFLVTADTVAGSEYLDQGLAGGQIYTYYVVAVDGAENQSEASDTVEARVP